MLIRLRGYNDGAKEYLEEGVKQGREHSRDELDERVILYGDLDLTQRIYQSTPDTGQERYLSYTMAFKEDQVSYDTLLDVTTEFKQFLLHAYKEHEINFYAEAHLPKIKQMRDKKTGEMIDRNPHIHIIIPRKNLFNGNEANPAGMHQGTERYMEAFQEYINQKYRLASPRDHIRFDPKDSASVLSRYKGDDFYGKNREFKQELVKQIVSQNILSRAAFYELVASYGETRIRNEGKENEYIAVKLPGDAKSTNLKDTIFKDDFVVRRQLKRPPLEKHVIQERLRDWPTRARELKYVDKATASFRELYYKKSTAEQKVALLHQREQSFYQNFGEHYGGIHPPKRPRSGQRSVVEAGPQRVDEAAGGMQDVPGRGLADHGQNDGQSERSLFLPGAAQLHVERAADGRDSGLRTSVPGGRGRRTRTRSGRTAGVSSGASNHAGAGRNKSASSDGNRRVIPPYGRDLHRIPTVADIEAFSSKLLQPHRPNEVADPDAAEATQRRRRPRKPQSGSMSKLPPYARNPHRTTTVADIEAYSSRLFDAHKGPAEGDSERAGPEAADDQAGRTQGPAQPQRRRKAGPVRIAVPPYARNPNKVATVADIEAHTRRLFAALRGDKPAQVFKVQGAKPVATTRNVSTVAASLSRSLEQSQLLPSQRSAIRRVDNQFYELRHFVYADARLTRQDKAQLFSVLTFERLKAREAIKHPKLINEVSFMGSASIRELLTEEEPNPEFSISGPGRANPQPIRERVQRLIGKLEKDVEPESGKEQERALQAADLYTKKARFGNNVHYVDKKTDKTVFVDTGKAIALRRTGINEAGVALALQMAQQRFGSTLTIKGGAEFKHLVIEAAAKNNMDIHFTDKDMNRQLAERRAELDLERDGHKIEQPARPEQADLATPSGSAPVQAQPAASQPVEIVHNGQALQVDPTNATDVATYARQLTAEVAVQSEQIEHSTQRLVELESMLSSQPAAREPERDAVPVVPDLGKMSPKQAFFSAIREADIDKAFQIMDHHKISPNIKTSAFGDPLVFLAVRGAMLGGDSFDGDKFLKGLIERGAKTDITLQGALKGASLLHVPSLQASTAKILIDSGVAIDVKRAKDGVTSVDVKGDTPLHTAVRYNNSALAGVLVAAGANTDMTNSRGENAISLGLESLPPVEPVVDRGVQSPESSTQLETQIEALRNQIASATLLKDQATASLSALTVAAAQHAQTSIQPTAANAAPKPVEGVLLDHGKAPYKHEEANESSYFVSLKTPEGVRTLWGAGLAELMQQGNFQQGERISLQDKGTEPVTLQLPQADGSVIEKDAYRRVWGAESSEPEKQTPEVVTTEIEERQELDID